MATKKASKKSSAKKSSAKRAAKGKAATGPTRIVNISEGDDDLDFTDGPENPNIKKPEETNGNGAAKKSKHARAVNVDLPGMEDRRIQPLHDTALEYVSKRDERQGVLAEEKILKDKLLGLMHRHKRDNYNCEGVLINIVPEGEKLVVKAPKKLDANGSDNSAE